MKEYLFALLASICAIAMLGCKSMNYIIENELSITGIVEEETDPLGIRTVYAITLKTPVTRNK